MIPLRDDTPTSTKPYVVYALIAMNVAVFLVQLSGILNNWTMIPYSAIHNMRIGMVADQFGRPLADQFGNPAFQLLPGIGPHPQWITIFTSMFMHGSLQHIGFNMLFLWIFGNNIEDALGHVKFAIFYLVCGVLAAGAHIFVSGGLASGLPIEHISNAIALKAISAGIPTLGASGAIAGVMGAYIVLYPSARVHTLIMLGWFWDTAEIPAVYFLGVWFLLQLIPGMGGQVGGGVAYWAHIGGFVAGAVIVLLIGRNKLTRQQRSYQSPWNEDKPYPWRPYK